MDWATMQACPVSSETIPRPKRKRCRSGGPKSRLARPGDSPSYGKPMASPIAVPRMEPTMCLCAIRKVGNDQTSAVKGLASVKAGVAEHNNHSSTISLRPERNDPTPHVSTPT